MLQYGKASPEIDRIQRLPNAWAKPPHVSARQPRCRCQNPSLHLHRPESQQIPGIATLTRLTYRHAARQSHLKIIGIDCHIRFLQLTDLSPLIEACERILIFG